MVSRGNQEQKKLRTQIGQHQHLHGASRAIWPISARRCVHTDRVAQRRRVCIMTGIGWVHTLEDWRMRNAQLAAQHLTFNRITQISLVFLALGSAFVLSAIYDWGMLLNHWVTFVLFALLCILTTLGIGYLRTGSKQEQQDLQMFNRPGISSFAGIPKSQMGQSVQSLSSLESGPTIPQTQAPGIFTFPDTPMPIPATPLVRVLETIDLSSTNVKHFLDIKPHPSLTGHRERESRKASKDLPVSD